MGYNSSSFSLLQSDVVGFTEAQRTSVELQLSVSIVSEGTLQYKNFKYPRYKNFYGYAQLMAGSFVVKSIALEYLNQQIYHFQQDSTDINQGIGCGIKKVLANLPTPVDSQVKIYLLRQPITSVRFRFQPGILANCIMDWHFPEQLCDEELIAPPDKQGNPSNPNNGGYNPGDRPAGQPGDTKDNSPNDGGSPSGGQNPPPLPGGGGGGGSSWKVVVRGYAEFPPPFTARYNTQVQDPGAVVTAVTVPVSGAQRPDGKTDKFLRVTINGNTTNTAASGGDLEVVAVYYGL